MKRKLYNSLIDWKNDPSRKPLVLEGARQVVTIDYAENHLKGLRCSMKPYIDQDWMENIPLYGILGYINSVTDQ